MAVSPRPGGDLRRPGKWLMIVAAGIVVAGFATWRVLLGDGQDTYGMLFVPIAAVTLCLSVPVGLIGVVFWLIGVAQSRRAGGGELSQARGP